MNPLRMAILTTDKVGAPVPAPRWPQRTTYGELIRIGQRMNADVFIAHPRDFDWLRGRVHGYTLQEDEDRPDRWVRRRYPMPHIVYNRVPSRHAEGHPAVKACLARLSRRLGPGLFNPFYLNKAKIFQLLSRNPDLTDYLPPTLAVRSWRDVQAMLQRFQRVYLKPSRGSLGNHTVEITMAPGRPFLGVYPYRYRFNLTSGRTRVAYARHLATVRSALQPLMARRPYIVQKAIDLLRLDGRPFDLRVLVQKDEQGKWIMSGAAARVAGAGQITTHVPRGGRRATMEEAMTALSPEAAAALQEELAVMTVSIARAIETELGRNFGELSMDIGVDQDGRPWLFEVNSKPLRFDEPVIRREAQARLIGYAHFLRETAVNPRLVQMGRRATQPRQGLDRDGRDGSDRPYGSPHESGRVQHGASVPSESRRPDRGAAGGTLGHDGRAVSVLPRAEPASEVHETGSSERDRASVDGP